MKEIIIDNFAGGGGASVGIEFATGESPAVAINHDPDAIAMHQVNHPETEHYCESVWNVNPRDAAAGRPVGLVWLSPDCKHFSKAKGSKPVEQSIRGLAWVAVRWAATVHPRVIMLENVEEFKTWGPVIPERDKETGRLMKKVLNPNDPNKYELVLSEPGEKVPHELRVYYPDPKRKGYTFNSFVSALKRQGYDVEWRELRACDYGAPTSRKRLFMVARCDGRPIVWPEPTHGAPDSPEVQSGKLAPWRTAAEIIDWSIKCNSIFSRKKELAENTKRRIARGIDRYIINNPRPLVMTSKNAVTPRIAQIRQTRFGSEQLQNELLRTVASGGHHKLISPTLIQMGYTERNGQAPRVLDLNKPVGTITAAGNKFAVAEAVLALPNSIPSKSAPIDTVAATASDKSALVTRPLLKYHETGKVGQPLTEPVPAITTGETHIGEVRSFLQQYYSSNKSGQKDDFGTVTIGDVNYQIVDIGMRMLEPHELFAAQGFPENYIIDVDADGKKYPKSKQLARCGNAVPPLFAKSLVRSNVPELCLGTGKILKFERYKPINGQMAFSM